MSEIYGESLVFAGGGGNIFAYIVVTYPSGATCTCTGNGKTLTAKDTSGKVVFGVKESGTYVVEALYGGKSSSESLNITVEGSVSEVKLSFAPEWYNTLKTQSVGETLTVDGYEWIIVNKTSTAAVLGLRYWYTDTVFGNNTSYAGSTIANLAATFESNTLSDATKAVLNNVMVNGVTAKVFIPTYEQMNGGFSHYATQSNRIFRDSGGNTKLTWTSSASGSSQVWRVHPDGGLSTFDGNPSYSFGFRPHMEVNLTL